MKKFKTLALMMCLAVFGMVFTSCQKDEDLIVGKWKVTSVSGADANSEDNGVGSVYEFTADKKLTVSYQGFSVSGTYSLDDDYLNLTISMLGMSETTKAKIDTLKKKKMVLSDPEDSNSKMELEKI